MTLVVNVISWNKAYALFPRASFIYHKSYLLKEMSDYVGKLLAKYDERGWTSQDVLWPEDEVSNRSMLVNRRIGDQHTWIIPLDTTDVARPDIPDTVLEYSTFRLSKCQKVDPELGDPDLGYYEVDTKNFESMVLKHKYSVSITRRDQRQFWTTFAGPRLERLSFLELCKIPPPQRPGGIQHEMDRVRRGNVYFCTLKHLLGSIQLPSYDSEIPKWYAEWERQQDPTS